MPAFGVGTRVRDTNTGLAGTIVDIFPQVEPWRDLVCIRPDDQDTAWGSLICSFDGEVEVLEDRAGEGVTE